MTGDAVLRWVRALTLASLLFLSGLAGHVAAGGVTPTASVLLRLFLLTLLVVAPFFGAALSPARLAALLIGGQGVLHAALQMSALQLSRAEAATATSPHASTHIGDGASHGGAIPLMSTGPIGMALAHVAAGLVVGAWLAVGELALSRMLAFTVRPVVEAWRSLTAMTRRVISGDGVGLPRPHADWLPRYSIRISVWAANVTPRRGPPPDASPEPYTYAAISPA
jgi:hypothetical protein